MSFDLIASDLSVMPRSLFRRASRDVSTIVMQTQATQTVLPLGRELHSNC